MVETIVNNGEWNYKINRENIGVGDNMNSNSVKTKNGIKLSRNSDNDLIQLIRESKGEIQHKKICFSFNESFLCRLSAIIIINMIIKGKN